MNGKTPRLLAGLALLLVMTGRLTCEDAAEPQPETLVARQDFDVNEELRPRQIMGRDFWHILGVNTYTQPDQGAYVGLMRELADKPLFRESGLNYQNDGVKAFVVPDSNRMSLSALDPKNYLALAESRPNAPFFIMPGSDRPALKLMKDWECYDKAYQTWKKAHPNFMGFINGETDNDFLSHVPWSGSVWWLKFKKECPDQELIATIERKFPQPQNREELTAQYLKLCERFRECFFKDARKVSHMCAAHCHPHYFYAVGADMAWLETTNTGSPEGRSNYRHQASLFFIRGASRQYRKNWAWYLATDLNGYDDQGRFSFSGPDYVNIKKTSSGAGGDAAGFTGPGCGMSPSLCERDMYLAYLSGASFVQHERWFAYLGASLKDGQWEKFNLSSPFGQSLESWFDFTRNNPDRGVSYAPVALLVPFEQGYPNYGGKSWQRFNYARGDWMIDAFMFTIMPHSPVTKTGDEGALANSPYGDIYDVIVPNTPGKPVSRKVLKNYKAAVMLGNHPGNKAVAKRLVEYVKDGGTLLINIQQINEFFPAKFLGFERATGPASPEEVKGPVRSIFDGKTFALSAGYEYEPVKLKGATPLLEDSSGNVLACKNSFGRGHVIVSTVDFMVPRNNMEYQGWDVLSKMVYGQKFPLVEYFLAGIVEEVLPLEVKGDIEYGLNKLDDGWLLYLINNQGVTKFTNKEQILDLSKTAQVEVFLRCIKATTVTELREQKAIECGDQNHVFTVDVPPGAIRVIKIKT